MRQDQERTLTRRMPRERESVEAQNQQLKSKVIQPSGDLVGGGTILERRQATAREHIISREETKKQPPMCETISEPR